MVTRATEPDAPRKRKAPDVRRREILSAVILVAGRKGWDGVTVRDVAETAGVAPGLIHHYFPSMDALLSESFGDWADESLDDLIDASVGDDPTMGLAVVVAALTEEQLLWNEALGISPRFAMLRDRARALSLSYQAHVEMLITRGVERGIFVCSDPAATAWRLILMLDGLLPMVYTLEVLQRRDIPGLIGPALERELSLGAGTFTALASQITDGVDARLILPMRP